MRRFLIVVAILVVAPLHIAAGGGVMPSQLLEDRARTLLSPPELSFAEEVLRLVRPPGYTPPRLVVRDWWRTAADERMEQDLESVGQSGLLRIEAMRSAASEREAVDLGAQLPAAIRRYTLGARAFHVGEFQAALAHFESVLALPGEGSLSRATWAQFMIGRSLRELGRLEQAADAFAGVRALVARNAPDTLGLALASLGEEARARLEHALATLDRAGGARATRRLRTAYAALERAITLYAEQAAQGDAGGIESLRMVSLEFVRSPHLELIVRQPTAQRLLLGYFLSRWRADIEWPVPDPEVTPDDQDADEPETDEADTAPSPDDADMASVDDWRNELERLLQVFLGLKPTELLGGDRLAAMAYSAGEYEMAARLAVVDTPLAAWIRAKLSLRDGDAGRSAEALTSVTTALLATPRDPGAPRSAFDLTLGELALVQLARGEHAHALAALVPVGIRFWGDLVHVAERVMTVDELRLFVDTRLPDLARRVLPGPVRRVEIDPEADPGADGETPDHDVSDRLRWLLARRLMRADRIEEALPYFPADTPYASLATALRRALVDGEHGALLTERARARFDAATLIRRYGMDLLGTEGPPDYRANGGRFPYGFADTDPMQFFVTDAERERIARHAPEPDLRFHYRYLAVQLAERAADDLPARSQAYAATLCHAALWLLQTGEVGLARDIHARYVREGAFLPWADRFGRACPEPDFEAASRFWLDRDERARQRHLRRLARQWIWSAGLGVVLVLCGTALFVWVRRRHASPRRA